MGKRNEKRDVLLFGPQLLVNARHEVCRSNDNPTDWKLVVVALLWKRGDQFSTHRHT